MNPYILKWVENLPNGFKRLVQTGCFAFLVFCTTSCQDDRKMVNIVLKSKGQFYTLSSYDTKDSSRVVQTIQIVEEEEKLFVKKKRLKSFIHLLSKEYKFLLNDSVHQQYHVMCNSTKVFKESTTNNRVTIVHPKTKKTLDIIWQKSPRLKAVKNCKVKTLWQVDPLNKSAGMQQKDYIMIDLDVLKEFLNPKIHIIYHPGEKNLYIIE